MVRTSRNESSTAPPRKGARPASAGRRPERVAPAQWDASLDDRPSERAVTIFWSGVGAALVASAAFLVWALSVERERRGEVQASASADPSVTVRPEPKRGDGEVVGAFAIGEGGASQLGWPDGDGILDAMDDAVGSCLPSVDQRQGAVVRLIARPEQGAPGQAALRIVALELQPRSGAALRFYGVDGREGHQLVDEAGARSCGVGWQSPLTHPRRTSRFNPKRMHPILHRVVPHQGTDYGASKGTPVYASYRGTLDWVGPHGAHGKWVSIIHPDGVETGYAHLSKFAPGVKRGDPVHAHQLIGYVGSTGRSTGPHLHWSARKDGAWFDAETLLAKASNALPTSERLAFFAMKGKLDRRLDAIPLPAPRTGPAAGGSLLPDAPPPAASVDLRLPPGR